MIKRLGHVHSFDQANCCLGHLIFRETFIGSIFALPTPIFAIKYLLESHWRFIWSTIFLHPLQTWEREQFNPTFDVFSRNSTFLIFCNYCFFAEQNAITLCNIFSNFKNTLHDTYVENVWLSTCPLKIVTFSNRRHSVSMITKIYDFDMISGRVAVQQSYVFKENFRYRIYFRIRLHPCGWLADCFNESLETCSTSLFKRAWIAPAPYFSKYLRTVQLLSWTRRIEQKLKMDRW